MSQERALDEGLSASRKPDVERAVDTERAARPSDAQQGVLRLQQTVGNRAIQRLFEPLSDCALQ